MVSAQKKIIDFMLGIMLGMGEGRGGLKCHHCQSQSIGLRGFDLLENFKATIITPHVRASPTAFGVIPLSAGLLPRSSFGTITLPSFAGAN